MTASAVSRILLADWSCGHLGRSLAQLCSLTCGCTS